MQSIDSIEIYAYEKNKDLVETYTYRTSKDLISEKEENKCNNILTLIRLGFLRLVYSWSVNLTPTRPPNHPTPPAVIFQEELI